ncbi:thymus-specific serine protease-like [Protopterus annectens]|uniref:thymus-specific serine protease-like n=1 Tax=Protopterus annectens TaxID=7888 RepID=UPI001CF98A6B|nr:thymus-specific serine protease-like [Protopterus annectens]
MKSYFCSTLLFFSFLVLWEFGIGGKNFFLIKQKLYQYRSLRAMKELYYLQHLQLGQAPANWNIPKEAFFTQPLDHFSRQTNATYNQRYWVNPDFWNSPNGPVFLHIGGEAALSEYSALAGEHVELAEKYGALVVSVEHRYYGASINLDGLTDKNIRFLSSQQALADLAAFHFHIVQQYNLTRNNTWICFGGSYPGSLSAWFRLKFPHLVYAAVASSAPVRAEMDFTGYNKVVSQSLSDPVVGGSPKCRRATAEAFHIVEQMVNDGKFAQLTEDYMACEQLTSEDCAEFVSDLADIFMGAVQYNKEAPTYNIAKFCNIMSNKSLGTTYSRLIVAVKQYMEDMSLHCMDYSYKKSLADLRNTTFSPVGVGLRQWYYQTCTEFGYYQTCEDESCPFSRLMTLEAQLDICSKVFGIDPKSVEQAVKFTNEYYGADHPKSSRIIFVNGTLI